MRALINYRELSQMVRTMGYRQTGSHLRESLVKGELKSNDFSLRDLAEATVPDGREWVRMMDPGKTGVDLTEAADAVSTAAFSNITGQIVYSKVLEAFQQPGFIGDQLVETIPTRLSGEKIAGVTTLGDDGQTVEEGYPYRSVGLTENWIETPATTKRGLIVPVTKEAIFFDRTNQVLGHASEVGKSLGFGKEKRILDCVVDLNSTAHRYKWRGNAVIATYGDASGGIGAHNFDNLAASNALVDWTDIEAAELLFTGMTDPYTGEPIMLIPNTLLVCPGLVQTARRVVNATEVRFGDGASSTSQTVGRNWVNSYNILSSALLSARVLAGSGLTTTWYLGDPKRAFAYMENWPITVTQAPQNSEAEFERDIVLRYKASERGAAATIDPRYMVKCTA